MLIPKKKKNFKIRLFFLIRFVILIKKINLLEIMIFYVNYLVLIIQNLKILL